MSLNNKQYGDYQTPIYFSKEIADFIKNEIKYIPNIAIEPTCGTGSFIKAINDKFENIAIIGNEINSDYVAETKKIKAINDNTIQITNEDYFKLNNINNIKKTDNLMIIGNPPWVTNSTISTEEGNNLPRKSNFKKMKGYDALTGSSNFDISEYMIMDLINKYSSHEPLIAMICKTTVAINIFKYIHKNDIGLEYFKIERINALEIFNVSVDACVVYIKLKNNEKSDVIEWIDRDNKGRKSGFIGSSFYMNLSENANKIEGQTEIEWRQGIKHDASKVMELTKIDSQSYLNGFKETITIESDRVFSLMKSSHFKEYIIKDFKRHVIVTQDLLKQDTNYIKNNSPLLWDYLNNKIDHFRKRKSSIYNNSPEFSMFGIGDYTWSKFKVGVSGFYKKPIFSLLVDDKPVMLDDTSYFLGFEDYNTAYTIMLILNSNQVQSFLKQIANLESKRPYTKKILSRISLEKSFDIISYENLKQLETELKLENYLTEDHYNETKKQFVKTQIKLDI